MAFELKMPQLGLTMEEGTVSKWIKHEGDEVKVGDVVVEITTDKLTNEVTSEAEGTMLKIVAQEGDDVPVKGLWHGSASPVSRLAALLPLPLPSTFCTCRSRSSCKARRRHQRDRHRRRPRRLCGSNPRRTAGRQGDPDRKAVSGRHLPERGLHSHQCLLHSAELVEDIKNQGKDIGVEVDGVKVNFQQVIAHKNDISKKLTGGVAGLLKMNKVKKIDGEATFVGEKKLSVKKADGTTEEMTADAIIVATGSINSPASYPRPEGEPQLHRLYRRSVSGEAAQDHGGYRRRRHRSGAGLRLRWLRYQDHRGGSHGSYAAHAGRRPDQDRCCPHEEDGYGVQSGMPCAVR